MHAFKDSMWWVKEKIFWVCMGQSQRMPVCMPTNGGDGRLRACADVPVKYRRIILASLHVGDATPSRRVGSIRRPPPYVLARGRARTNVCAPPCLLTLVSISIVNPGLIQWSHGSSATQSVAFCSFLARPHARGLACPRPPAARDMPYQWSMA
jgi:hypothetical protein